jgi:tRNA modification GTPase
MPTVAAWPKPGEYAMRAFLNRKMDLSQAEAIADLVASTSAAAHKVAMHQMRGGFSRDLQLLRDELIHFASLIELELDFAEEDVEFADRTQMKALIHRMVTAITKLDWFVRIGKRDKRRRASGHYWRAQRWKIHLIECLSQ